VTFEQTVRSVVTVSFSSIVVHLGSGQPKATLWDRLIVRQGSIKGLQTAEWEASLTHPGLIIAGRAMGIPDFLGRLLNRTREIIGGNAALNDELTLFLRQFRGNSAVKDQHPQTQVCLPTFINDKAPLARFAIEANLHAEIKSRQHQSRTNKVAQRVGAISERTDVYRIATNGQPEV
jgi:hypothetical protein